MISDRDSYIVINYHYVEDPRGDRKGINPCRVSEFARQMRFISDRFDVLTVPDIFRAAVEKRTGKFCAITFDDCLRGVYTNAVPILKEYAFKGTFFAITSVFSGSLPSVHKIHALLSKLPAADLVGIFNDWIDEAYSESAEQFIIPTDYRIESRRSYDNVITANFKERLILLPKSIKEEFLGYCFKYLSLNESELNQEWFMTSREIRELYDMGMTIGSHTHSHDSLEILAAGGLAKEIILSGDIIADITGAHPAVFSYPHGRWQKSAAPILSKAGIKYAVTIEKRGIEPSDHPLFIPRCDTNELRDYLDAVGYR